MKKNKSIALGLVALSGLLLSFQNCSPDGKSVSGTTNLSSTDPHTFVDTGTGTGGTFAPVDAKIYAVIHSENLLPTMQNETGVKSVTTNAIKNMVATQITKVSDKGSADSITAPMQLAVVSIAGEVCSQLITEETTTKRIFTGVNYAAALTATMKDDVIRRMARSFWSRNETQEEHDAIRADLDALDGLNTTTTAVAGKTSNALLYVCTAMLSSLDAQKQ